MNATDLFLSDIAAIRTSASLRIWGEQWAPEIQATGQRDIIAKAYKQRLAELEKSECQSKGQDAKRK